jgi:hypothetical protein
MIFKSRLNDHFSTWYRSDAIRRWIVWYVLISLPELLTVIWKAISALRVLDGDARNDKSYEPLASDVSS